MLANARASRDLVKLYASPNDNENMWKHVKLQSRLGSGIKRLVLTFSVFNGSADCTVICNELCMPQMMCFWSLFGNLKCAFCKRAVYIRENDHLAEARCALLISRCAMGRLTNVERNDAIWIPRMRNCLVGPHQSDLLHQAWFWKKNTEKYAAENVKMCTALKRGAHFAYANMRTLAPDHCTDLCDGSLLSLNPLLCLRWITGNRLEALPVTWWIIGGSPPNMESLEREARNLESYT